MSAIKDQIQFWKEGLLAPNQNDVLLTLNATKNALEIQCDTLENIDIYIAENTLLKKLYKQHQQSIKETGSPIFGVLHELIHFSFDGKEFKMPFLLASATIQKNRFNNSYHIQQTEDFYINPLLLTTISLDETLSEDIAEAKKQLHALGLEFHISEGTWVANFHPHRFVLQKEFDALLSTPQFSPSLSSLFGENNTATEIDLSPYFLYPADESQRQAIDKVKKENTVIQGPPGTGKSQVIINLIGKTLGVGGRSIVIAEKPVALQVIYDDLEKKGLHHFCVLYHHELKAKHFISSLKDTWRFIEELPKSSVNLNQRSNLLRQGLDLTLERLKQNDLIGGISFTDFKSKFRLVEDAIYSSVKPTIPIWESELKLLKQIESTHFSVFGSWLILPLNQHALPEIESKINQTIALLSTLTEKNITLADLDEYLKLSGLVSLFYFNDKPLPLSLFETGHKKQKSFLKHYKKLKFLTEREALLKEEEKHWKKNFSLSELQEYITALGSTNPFNLRFRSTRNKLLKFTDLNLVEGKKALENLVKLKEIQEDIVALKDKLRKQDLPEELPVLEHIYFVIEKLKSVNQNDIQLLFNKSKEERLNISNAAPIYNDIHHNLRHYFNVKPGLPIEKQLLDLKKAFPSIIGNSAQLKEISRETKDVLQISANLDEASDIIYNSHWKDFKGQFPSLAKTNGGEIKLKIEEIIVAFEKESENFSIAIQQEIKTTFDTFHALLQTPANKLSKEDKALKARLRKGKSILVKAFNKKRVFPSVRELLESEAREWIQLLQPIFLCSPYSVAKSIPLNFNFDLGVFDEASQIPLSHVIGGVQRSKRVVISGDQQQMAPSFYFQKKDLAQSDALHHASFYWENTMLTHHYRSKYPELIAFSNQYFYANKLKTFPVPNQSGQAIELITTDGIFIDRKNEKEADIVANLIINKIKRKEFDFGLVAFSQAQLNTILSKIPMELLDLLEGKDTLFIQSLENVQGDQCEHLIISLGYAKNEEGEFHKRFGPLNQEQGYRRLNVLMSRAISKITFVRSVTSLDFALSTNEGVELLRKLMYFLERQPSKSVLNTSFEGVETANSTLTIPGLATSFKNAQTLIDFYQTSKNRGWEIEVE